MAARSLCYSAGIWCQVSAGLQNDEQESRPLTPEDVICINAPHNRIDSASLSDGLHQFGHLCMLGLQNNALSSIDPQVRLQTRYSAETQDILVTKTRIAALCVKTHLKFTQVLPKSLLYLNLASNDLTSLGNLKLPKLVSLDASNNSLQVRVLKQRPLHREAVVRKASFWHDPASRISSYMQVWLEAHKSKPH